MDNKTLYFYFFLGQPTSVGLFVYRYRFTDLCVFMLLFRVSLRYVYFLSFNMDQVNSV